MLGLRALRKPLRNHSSRERHATRAESAEWWGKDENWSHITFWFSSEGASSLHVHVFRDIYCIYNIIPSPLTWAQLDFNGPLLGFYWLNFSFIVPLCFKSPVGTSLLSALLFTPSCLSHLLVKYGGDSSAALGLKQEEKISSEFSLFMCVSSVITGDAAHTHVGLYSQVHYHY